MAESQFDARFTNDIAMNAFIATLTNSFTRMGALAEMATTPHAALHEALDVSNAAFAALPLPQDDTVILRAALAAKRAHVKLLRTLADFDASSIDSRRSYDARVAHASGESMAKRSALLQTVADRTSKKQQTSAETSREIVDFIAAIYGDSNVKPSRQAADITTGARSWNALETLIIRVGERYAPPDTEYTRPNDVVVEPFIEHERVGASLIDAHIDKRAGVHARDDLLREVQQLLAPNRGRAQLRESYPTALTAAAHRLRAHTQFVPKVVSGVKYLPGAGEDIVEIERKYLENAGLFRRVLRAAWQIAGDLRSFPEALFQDSETTRRQRRRTTMWNRHNELQERITAVREAERSQTGAEIEKLIRQQLAADVRRADRYFVWYEDQLRSIFEAEITEANLVAVLDDVRLGQTADDARRQFMTAYQKQMDAEVLRLRYRLRLIDAELGGRSDALTITREERLYAARAEIADRLYESNQTLALRLARNPALSGVLVQYDAETGYVRVDEDPSAPLEVYALPATATRLPPELFNTTSTSSKPLLGERLPGLDVLADPALDDGDIWLTGFKGRLSPELVELYFACRNSSLVDESAKVARLTLLHTYVQSVGTIYRASLRGFATVDVSVPTSSFFAMVDARVRAVVRTSFDDLIYALIRFSVDEDRVRAAAIAQERAPRVLARVPVAGDSAGLHRSALAAIHEVMQLFRSESLSAVYQLGDTLSIVNHAESRTEALGIASINIAPGVALTDVQRERALASIDRASELVLLGTNRALTQRASDDVSVLAATSLSIDAAFKNFTVQPLGFTNMLRSGAENATSNHRLIYVGRRVPASFIDPTFGDLLADIEYRAASSDESANNTEALERILASTDTRMLRTITRYEMAGPSVVGATRELYVEDVLRYANATQATRLQIVDLFDRSTVTLTLRDPVTDRAQMRILDRVVFGRNATNETDAQQIIDSLRNEVAASSAGQPLLALVAALFVRARFSATRGSAFENLPSRNNDDADDESILERIMSMPARGYRAFTSLTDVFAAFRYERNFASQATIALSIAFANLNFLVLLFGVAQAIWPSVMFTLRALGIVDAAARLFFEALIGAGRRIGIGMSWTLMSNLLGLFRTMSRRHPRAGEARREAALLQQYVAEMTAEPGQKLSPLDAIPGSRELFIDRMYRFVITYGSPLRTDVAKRAFVTMIDALFKPLYSLLEKIPQSIAGTVGMATAIAAGGSVSGSPLSVLALSTLNVFSTILLVWTRSACNNVVLSFSSVVFANVTTRIAWLLTFRALLSLVPTESTGRPAGDSFPRALRYAITTVSIIGPDMTSYLSGREYLITDALQAIARSTQALVFGQPLTAPSNLMRHLDPTSTYGVSRFIDRPSQAIEAYVSFAGRLAGRTMWGVLRTYFEHVSLRDLTEQAARTATASQRTGVTADPRNTVDTSTPYTDQLDQLENVSNTEATRLMTRAFFERNGESDIWIRLLQQSLVVYDRRLAIDIGGEFIGPATRNNRFTHRRQQTFRVARNFLFIITRSPNTPIFRTIVFARATFVAEFTASSVEEAQRALSRTLMQHEQHTTNAREGIFNAESGERIRYDSETPSADIERIGETDAYRAWRMFYFDTVRLREFGVIVDRVAALSGVRLVDIELHVNRLVDDDDAVYDIVEQQIEHMLRARTFVELVHDVNIDEFAAEVVAFAL